MVFVEKEVRNKIALMLKKGKQIYQQHGRKTGQAVDSEAELELEMEAAQGAWPNFKTFYVHFKDHPSLGPGSVEDSLSAPVADDVDKSHPSQSMLTAVRRMMKKRKRRRKKASHHQLRKLLDY